MSKDHKGFIVERDGKIYVMVHYTDGLGKRRELMRLAKDRKHARQLRKELVKQVDSANREDQVTDVSTDKTTFAKIAERYEAVRLIPAQYVGDTKIAGLRSLRTPKGYLKRLVDHFGNARIRSITYSQVDEYRLKRLKEGVKIASVNRELALLRTVFNFAKRDGLIARTPFERGVPLISLADEVKRDRVLSQDEEKRLLASCADPVRAHLKTLIIAAVDTGMRKGEILSLEWQDVDFEHRTITVRAMNTKTLTARVVPITSRLLDTLQSLHRSNDVAVFGTIKDIKRSWRTACDKAKIKGLRFHDLRATFATRLISAGMPIEEVAKITGHTQLSTLYSHYIRNTASAVERAANLLDSING